MIAQGIKEDQCWVVKPGSAKQWSLHHISMSSVKKGARVLIIEKFALGVDEPYLDTGPIELQTDQARYLYLILQAPSPVQMVIYFRRDGDVGFDPRRSFMIERPVYPPGLTCYRLDLSNVAHWSGVVSELRVHFEGLMEGAEIRFGGVAVSERASIKLAGSDAQYPVSPVGVMPAYLGERFVACSRTVLSIDESVPTPGLSTYISNPATLNPYGLQFDPQKQFGLCKFCSRT